MRPAQKPFWRHIGLGFGAVLISPILVSLFIGRIIFFAVLDIVEAAQEKIGRVTVAPGHGGGGLLPFWLAWLMAVMLLAGTLAGSIFVVTHTRAWLLPDQLVARGCVVLLAIAALYIAFRLALSGTAMLQRALAYNLARLIAFELDDLRAHADLRIEYLTIHGLTAPSADEVSLPTSPVMPVPAFFGETDDIAKLLGEPTERALEDLLASLNAFNNAVSAASVDRMTRGAAARQMAHLQLRRQLGKVHERLGQAMLVVNPLCQRQM